MADEAKTNELAEARAEYKKATGKNPSPRLDAAGVRAKLAERLAAPPAEEAPAKPKRAARAAAPAAASEATPSPLGTAYVRHPEGVGCSIGGVSIEPDKKSGKLLVPLDAVADLQSHGFEIV